MAQFNTGIAWALGQGVAKDQAEAVRWFKMAAVQGHGSAQLNLGMSYFNGQGVARDLVRAHMWLHLAAASGDKEAARNEALVAREMTPAQIESAQRLAVEWQARRSRAIH